MLVKKEYVNDTAVIICNFNKKEYVRNCIKSLKKQTYKSFDIFVVDNASTDGSADMIRKEFGEKVSLICNTVNLGGSGGFNTGMRKAMEYDYQYLVLLDNDVELKEDCIEQFISTMENIKEIGIMGAKIMKMDYPDTIQEFAPTVNYRTITFELHHGGEKDDGSLPPLKDCDYVPACALIVRRDVIEKIGYMPEENFIYYDDITWGVKAIRAGYRVVANSKATVWHKGGAFINPTTFGSYYLNRNKVRFFASYMSTNETKIKNEQINQRSEYIMLDIFEGIYSCMHDGRFAVAKTRMDAFLDALYGKTGKAIAYEIRIREETESKFDKLLKQSSNILIYMNGQWENTRRIVTLIFLLKNKWSQEISVTLVDKVNYGKQLVGIEIEKEITCEEFFYDAVFEVCKHIYETEELSNRHILIDGWCNGIFDEDDRMNHEKFAESYELFKNCFEDRTREYVKENIT